jgi:glycosyltransferase involved in cell wall biosynthesis
LKQTYTDFEALCADDGSTDYSGVHLRRYAAKDNRIKVFTQKNKGQSAARNLALEHAKGGLVVFADADDKLDEKTLEICVRLFNEYELGIDAVIYNARYFSGDIKLQLFKEGIMAHAVPEIIDCKTDDCLPIFSNMWMFCVKREVITKNDITFPEAAVCEDAAFCAKLLTSCDKVYWYKEPLYYYRTATGNNLSSDVSLRCLDMFKMFETAKEYFIEAGVWGNVEYRFYFWYLAGVIIPFWHYKVKNAFEGVRVRYRNELVRFAGGIPKTMFIAICSYCTPEDKRFLFKLREDIPQSAYAHINTQKENASARSRLRSFLLKISPKYKAAFDSRELLKDILWRLNQTQNTNDEIRDRLKGMEDERMLG